MFFLTSWRNFRREGCAGHDRRPVCRVPIVRWGTHIATVVVSLLAVTTGFAGTLDDVKSRGMLACGVNEGLSGFSIQGDGEWRGLDVDFCRAIAAAIFGDATKVEFRPLTATHRFDALRQGEVDILARNTTWTATRDTDQGLSFVGINYFDGQSFMVRKLLGVLSALQLNGSTICVASDTTTRMNVADYFRVNEMTYQEAVLENAEQVVQAYDRGECDVYPADQSALYAQRLNLTNPGEHIILPEVASKEPLGPVVRDDDPKWFDLVRWTLFAMINAEEYGITSKTADEMKESDNPSVRRLLGVDGAIGEGMGVGNDWAYNIITMVGNYGESFDRNVGPDTALGIPRGINALWTKGGLMYAPPVH